MTLRRELLAALVISALTAALLMVLGGAWLLRSSVRESFVERIRSETRLLADWVGSHPDDSPQDTAVAAAGGLGCRVTLIGRDGVVLGDSAKDLPGVRAMDNHLHRPEIAAARRAGAGESFRVSDTTDVEYFYSAHIVEGAGRVRFARIALPSSRVDATQSRYVWLLAGLALGGMLLLTVVAYGAVRRLSRRVEDMALAAERAADGDLVLTVPEKGRDEVTRLARALNRMREAVLARIAERESERAFLASVIAEMREGLLLVGPDRRIRLANAALREILRLPFDPAGHLLAEVVRHPAVLRDAETVLSERREVRDSVFAVPGTGRIFELHATPLVADAGTGALVLFFDITRLEALERMRRDFVANVSHELRTPLTSIKAFVETLVDGGLDDGENARDFLRIVQKHSDRMEALIDDLTDLSLIETGSITLEMQEVDVAPVAREVAENLRPLSTEQEVTVSVDLPSRCIVLADRRRLEQMLTNLVSNAVKFNRAGGSVRLWERRQNGGRTIVVEDSGEGIPEDQLEQVFRRFHRVDPNRSRELGGTGLGLAIVKHLIRLHGGRVWVESELGRGARFFLEFPEAPPTRTGRNGRPS